MFDPADRAGLAGCKLAEAAAGKSLSQLRHGICADRRTVMVQLFGPEDAGYLLHLTGKLIGMQYFDEIARGFSAARGGCKRIRGLPARDARSAGRCCRDRRIRRRV